MPMNSVKRQNRRGLWWATLAASFVLVACDDGDSGVTEAPKVPNTSVAAMEDLPNCTEKREGETAFVTEDNATYKCKSGKWEFESAPIKAVETLDDLSNCTSKVDGDTVKVKSERAFYRCDDGKWRKYRAIIDTLTKADDLLACVSKRDGNAAYIIEERVLYRCDDGVWKKEISFMDTTSSKENLPNCTGKKEGDSSFVKKEGVVYLCIEKKWRYLGEVAENEDSLPNCTEKRDGVKKFVVDESVTLICSEGKWLRYDIYTEIEPKETSESSSSLEDLAPESSDSKKSSSSEKASSSSAGQSSSSFEIDWDKITCGNAPATTQTAGPDHGWGDFGYVIPLEVTGSNRQEIYLSFDTTETGINGPDRWDTFGVLIAQYDASKKQWIPGTEIFSNDLKDARSLYADYSTVNTFGFFEHFTFDTKGTWLEEYAGKTIDAVVAFYAPGTRSDSSGMGLDYYSIPTPKVPALYFSTNELECSLPLKGRKITSFFRCQIDADTTVGYAGDIGQGDTVTWMVRNDGPFAKLVGKSWFSIEANGGEVINIRTINDSEGVVSVVYPTRGAFKASLSFTFWPNERNECDIKTTLKHESGPRSDSLKVLPPSPKGCVCSDSIIDVGNVVFSVDGCMSDTPITDYMWVGLPKNASQMGQKKASIVYGAGEVMYNIPVVTVTNEAGGKVFVACPKLQTFTEYGDGRRNMPAGDWLVGLEVENIYEGYGCHFYCSASNMSFLIVEGKSYDIFRGIELPKSYCMSRSLIRMTLSDDAECYLSQF